MGEAAKLTNLIKRAENWAAPIFPISGQDLSEIGFEPGKEMGAKLVELEDKWVESNFMLSKEQLLDGLSAD